MQPITALRNSPLNGLFLAINHYVSTGDHLGEGVAMPEGEQRHATGEPHKDDQIRVIVAMDIGNPTDVADFEKFRSKFSKIAIEFDTNLTHEGVHGGMRIYTFVIRYRQCEKMAQRLTESPGPLGWGSPKELIDKHLIQ